MLRPHTAFAVLLFSALLPVGFASSAAADVKPGAVCDHQPAADASSPAGAVVVDSRVDNDLYLKTQASPAGTTFWLRPGTHTLGSDEFGQVVPKDRDVYLGAPGAVLDGRGVNRAAFTQEASDVVIRNLTIQHFAALQDQGVVNHDSGAHWVIEHNTIQDNKGAAMMAGDRQEVRANCLRNNGQYGMNAYRTGDGITGLVVEGNEISGNNTDDWEQKVTGCGCSGGVKFWAVNGADVRGNWIHHNHGAGLWADTNDNDFLVQDNLIEDNESEGLFYEISYNLEVAGNTFRRNALKMGRDFAGRGDNFPVGALYLSESGGESRVPARTAKIDIHDNAFEDNWSGITLWENADRFCNSPANTSSGSCTKLVSPTSACAQPAIASRPRYDDCRWKTQQVDIHGNTFSFDPGRIGCTGGLCGRMAVLANFGSYPEWSPYKGAGVSDAITSSQGNHFRGNTYSGPWTFVAHDTSRTLTAAQWQAAPYSQDACSSFTGGTPAC
ncbi:right-handed parallel beta-helix repeat-containing protein [Amycolatopsis sp. H20-H5]|uniref:right-handed parallel beta-helix repeat-containing protein n=1 Tax=Amycolatopsis sp. H20-H5 TaxID=3046309 RepID=UPI002DB9F249|nr:right-handed parallel beta-helix repeat-containing protein [Amycolatopsis sp. H20-H5]MEC3976536.1 right-handed parallel beta-helix repeat-containing protein [Amycolatopsis sp. H20-H5]